MRLPWGRLSDIVTVFFRDMDFGIFGCLSSEERCCCIPQKLLSKKCREVKLLEIMDPPGAFPDYSTETKGKIEQNKQRLREAKVNFQSTVVDLLATEDQMLDILNSCKGPKMSSILVLDITSLPKRYFCFFIKRMLLSSSFCNVVVTYAQPEVYTHEHLAEDPMTCDNLPGYAAPLPPRGNTLVISVGFELLNIRSLLEVYRDKKKTTKIILPFPPDGWSARRPWNTLKQLVSDDAKNITKNTLEIVAAWDAEQVYKTLERWHQDADGLTLAPFGPKPHSLGMALFANKYDAGLYYTQPKAYNPDYSKGYGESWAYVIKWEGIPCFERPSGLP